MACYVALLAAALDPVGNALHAAHDVFVLSGVAEADVLAIARHPVAARPAADVILDAVLVLERDDDPIERVTEVAPAPVAEAEIAPVVEAAAPVAQETTVAEAAPEPYVEPARTVVTEVPEPIFSLASVVAMRSRPSV